MLPDYPEIKNAFQKVFTERIRKRNEALTAPFSKSPKIIMHEGDTWTIIRENGESETSTPQAVKGQISVSHDEAESMTLQQVFSRADELADQMAREMMELHVSVLEDATAKSGNRVDANGHLEPHHVIEMFSKVALEFDRDGRIQMEHVAGTKAAAALKRVMNQIETTPDLNRQLKAVIDRKKDEWRDREASRKLVG